MTSSCLFNRGTNFSQAVTDNSLRNISENDNFFGFKQARNYGGAEGRSPLKIFSPLLEKCVGYSFKNLGPSQKTLPPSGVPSWLRAWS